jgi:hypothetical protein
LPYIIIIIIKTRKMRWTGHVARMGAMIRNPYTISVGKPEGIWEGYKKVYSKVSGLAAWIENCKCYSSLPLGAIVSLHCESV